MSLECQFCKKTFKKEKTLSVHLCEQKRRWINKDSKYVRLGFLAYNRFYEITQGSSTQKTYEHFSKSNYYTAFTKFGRHILEINAIDAIWIPRINIVEGITQNHIDKWSWTINQDGWINWPNDAQLRVYANKPEIKWEGKVHEKIVGYEQYTLLPQSVEMSLNHPKQLERQEKQNEFYEKL